MDQIVARSDGGDGVLPVDSRQTASVAPDPAIVDPAEHNVVFTSLVTGDKDIVGLVAYSIYKQNKYDWLQAYSRLLGRMPDAAEAHAYLLGESTPRRLATYRHLAKAVLAGRGPDVPGAVGGVDNETSYSGDGSSSRARPGRESATGRAGVDLSTRVILGLCIALGVLLVTFWVLHSGTPLPSAPPK